MISPGAPLRIALGTALLAYAGAACSSGHSTRPAVPHGVLDAGFGSAGLVTDDIAHGADSAKMVLVDGAGRILLAGRAQDVTQSFDGNLAIMRLTSSGVLDPTFGSGGVALQNLGSQEDAALSLALLADGRLRTAGLFVTTNGRAVLALSGFDANGDVDPSFGAGGGEPIVTDFGTSLDGIAHPLAIDGAGRMIVAGSGTAGMSVMRFGADGTVDPSFGVGGIASGSSEIHDSAYALLVAPDGKILVSGGPGAMEIARFLPDGALDATFGSGGKILHGFLVGLETGRALALQSDGKLVVLVVDQNANGGIDAILARYDDAGQPDPTFGGGTGWVTFEFSSLYVGGADLTLQPDGKILIAGTHYDLDYSFELARFLPDGSPDLDFGDAGRLITPFHSSAFAHAITLQPDGRILVAGDAQGDWYTDFAVARFLP